VRSKVLKGSSMVSATGDQELENRTSAGRLSAKPMPSVSDYLAGETQDFISNLRPYLPQELVGGTIPHIAGTEEEAVWNAASQACGTEKIHYCYSILDEKIFYLACPSSILASHPDSWCPIAAALPGNSEFWDKETVYIYESEGFAAAIRWDTETGRMQVFLGASRTILPRVQSIDANFVTINAEIADVVPWRNRNLRTEKLSRATVKMLIFTGLFVSFCALGLLFFSYISYNMLDRNLDKVQVQTEEASISLIRDANIAIKSDTAKHMARIQEILDFMTTVSGTLVRYEVAKDGSAQWEALIGSAYISNTMEQFPVRIDNVNKPKDGRIRVIGTR